MHFPYSTTTSVVGVGRKLPVSWISLYFEFIFGSRSEYCTTQFMPARPSHIGYSVDKRLLRSESSVLFQIPVPHIKSLYLCFVSHCVLAKLFRNFVWKWKCYISCYSIDSIKQTTIFTVANMDLSNPPKCRAIIFRKSSIKVALPSNGLRHIAQHHVNSDFDIRIMRQPHKKKAIKLPKFTCARKPSAHTWLFSFRPSHFRKL